MKRKAPKIWVSSFSPRTHSMKVLGVRSLHLFLLTASQVHNLMPVSDSTSQFPPQPECLPLPSHNPGHTPPGALPFLLAPTQVEARISFWWGSGLIRGTNRQARKLIPSNIQFPRETLLWLLSKRVLWSDARNCLTEGGIECIGAPSTGWVVTSWMLSSDRLLLALLSFSFHPHLTFGLENQVHQSLGAPTRISTSG